MRWSSAGPYCALVYIALLVLFSGISRVVKENRSRRTRELLARLNSPYFRQITDAHYRAGKL
jgi:hypothetical protein